MTERDRKPIGTRCFKEALTRRGLIGASITFTDPMVTYAIADSVDFIWIDLEHSPMSAEALRNHLVCCQAKNRPALVRTSSSSTAEIKGILDSGADGIVVPQVKDPEEVRTIIEACLYTPAGQRGFGPRVPSNFGRISCGDLIQQENRRVFVAVMIENRSAVDNLDGILALDSLDAVVIGPMDLSCSIGLPGQAQNPEVDKIISKVILRAHKSGKTAGIGLEADTQTAEKYLRMGIDWIQFGCDFSYMVSFLEERLSALREFGGKRGER